MRLEYVKDKKKRERYLKGQRTKAYRIFLRLAKNLNANTFLDVGSGDEKFSNVVNDLFKENTYLICTELDWQNAKKIAQESMKYRNVSCDVVLTEAYNLPIRDGSIDGVSSFNVINWKPMNAYKHLDEVERVSKICYLISLYIGLYPESLKINKKYLQEVPPEVHYKLIDNHMSRFDYKDQNGILRGYFVRKNLNLAK